MQDLDELQSKIDIDFNNRMLLRQAFVHSSYLNENPDFGSPDNERLEFLGDAVLNLVVAERIFHKFPSLQEGKLTEIRVSAIREETLAALASDLSLGEYLLLSKGEENTGGRKKQGNLANTFEALIGAIFLDQDIDNARQFILPRIEPYLKEIGDIQLIQNYKGKLQEYLQSVYKVLPLYRVTETTGPDHDKNFNVEVLLGNQVIGTGSGKNKKIAEMNAAKAACQQFGIK